jgi:hypothetical protein
MPMKFYLNNGRMLRGAYVVRDDIHVAPYVLRYKESLYRFVGYDVATKDACYDPTTVYDLKEQEKPKVTQQLDRARLEDSDGKLYAAIKLDSTAGAPRVLFFKNLCFIFKNYGSTIQIPTYMMCAWEILPDDVEIKDAV